MPGKTMMLLHGAWMTPASWEPFKRYFTERGYHVLAPAWPGKQGSVEEIRRDPSALAGLGGEQIIDHYAAVIRSLPSPPVLLGHSFGGLFVQVLLSRGLGAAGVAIDSAPPRGIIATQPSAYRALGGVVANPANRKKVVHWNLDQFRYAFMHTQSEQQVRHAYDTFVTPETGRIFFQAALSALDRNSPFRVQFAKPDRAPLLMIAGEKDNIVPSSLNRANHRRYSHGPAVTDFREFAGRTHWIIAQDGWEEVAGFADTWLDRHVG